MFFYVNDDDHAADVAEVVEQTDNLPPVGECVDIALAVAAVRLFDGTDSEVLADLVPNEPLQPVGGVQHDGAEGVLLVAKGGQRVQDVVQAVRQRELGGADLVQAVFGLDEYGVGGAGRIVLFPTPSVP